MARTKVLVVDDSALMRQIMCEILGREPSIEVVGTAPDPVAAIAKIKQLSPDVLTLDVEMPRMDGLTFLEKLMRARPMPVVMVSSLTERGCATTMKALELGAIDFVTKPSVDLRQGVEELAVEIVEKVRIAAAARVQRRTPDGAAPVAVAKAAPAPMLRTTHKVIAIGASTGGTEAILAVMRRLPADAPGVVIVQHMPERFTRSFADRLDGYCAMRVREAVDGERVLPGHALLAPGNFHLRVERSGASYVARVDQSPPVSRHRPSVDVLFHSCATAVGANGVAVILTGMGDDGARGMRAMRDAGARTVAQDEASCVVFGMPKAAIAAGGVETVTPLDTVAGAVLRMVQDR